MSKKIFEIDNMPYLIKLCLINANETIKTLIYKNKVIAIPREAKPTPNGNHLPHIKICETEYKYCPKCREWRSLFAFNKNKFTPDKLKNICRDCDNKQRRDRYAKTRAVT